VSSRIAPLLVLLTVASTCASPTADGPVGEGAPTTNDLTELMLHSTKLKNCTATYRAKGPLEESIRFTFAAPDRVCIESSAMYEGRRFDDTIWSVGDRYIRRSMDGRGFEHADVPLAIPTQGDCEALGVALERAFPSSVDGEAERDVGSGAGIDSRFGGEFRLIVFLSMSSYFLERITGAAEEFELVDSSPSADEAAFTIPPPEPGSNDASQEDGCFVFYYCGRVMNYSITQFAKEARERDSIADEDFTRRLASVYEVVNRWHRRDRFAQMRDSMNQWSSDAADLYRRQRSAVEIDPDLRGTEDQWIAVQRREIVESLQTVTEAQLDSDSPFPPPTLADADPHVAALIAEAHRRSLAATVESEVTQPCLAYFDEQVLAVQSTK